MIKVTPEIIISIQQLKGVGDRTIFKILNSTPVASITSLQDIYTILHSMGGKTLSSITMDDLRDANIAAQRIMEKSAKNGIGVISYYDDAYPEILRSCKNEKGKLEEPLILYYRGNLEALKKPGIAIIGTREPTASGVKAGHYFAAEFAKRGYNIVSGLAIGCDTTGHEGALSVNGTTTAFLANGLDWDSIYPKENLNLAKDIVTNGGILLSEYSIGQQCGRYGLVARDRLQAGLSLATVVIQTGITGGTMHAANATLLSNKPLFCVAYKNKEDFMDEKVQGNIMLVKEKGAHFLSSSDLDNAISIIKLSKVQTSAPTSEDPQTTLF
jgi:DNA processing protein